jgi:hypothetical protein
MLTFEPMPCDAEKLPEPDDFENFQAYPGIKVFDSVAVNLCER